MIVERTFVSLRIIFIVRNASFIDVTELIVSIIKKLLYNLSFCRCFQTIPGPQRLVRLLLRQFLCKFAKSYFQILCTLISKEKTFWVSSGMYKMYKVLSIIILQDIYSYGNYEKSRKISKSSQLKKVKYIRKMLQYNKL